MSVKKSRVSYPLTTIGPNGSRRDLCGVRVLFWKILTVKIMAWSAVCNSHGLNCFDMRSFRVQACLATSNVGLLAQSIQVGRNSADMEMENLAHLL